MSSPYDGSLVTRPKLLAIFVIGIVGGLLVLGGLAAITNDSPVGVGPYKFGWYLWSYELVILLFFLFAIFKDFHGARLLLVALYAPQAALYTDRIELFLDKGAALPGSTDQRGDVIAAGLILVAIANFLVLISAGVSWWEDHVKSQKIEVHGSNGKV